MVEGGACDERHHELGQRQCDVEESHVFGAVGPIWERVAGKRPIDRVVQAVTDPVSDYKREHDRYRLQIKSNEYQGHKSLKSSAREDEDLAAIVPMRKVTAQQPKRDGCQE